MNYYAYDKNGFYTKKVEAETQPENTSQFAPPETEKGTQPWFDGVGWRIVANYSDLPLATAREQATDELYSVTFVYEPDFEYSAAERGSFDAQYAEALAVKEGGEPGIYLEKLMGVYDLSAVQMADKIIAKREEYNQARAEFNAKVQALRLRIKNAKTSSDIPSAAELRNL